MSTDTQNNKRLIAAVIALAGALLAAAWLLGCFQTETPYSRDREVADLQRAVEQMDRDSGGHLKQRYAELSPSQQRDFDGRMQRSMRIGFERSLRGFFSLPPAEQQRAIDREIDASLAKSKKVTAAGPAAATAGGKLQADAKPVIAPGQALAMKQSWMSQASPELRSMIDRKVRMTNERRRARRHAATLAIHQHQQ